MKYRAVGVLLAAASLLFALVVPAGAARPGTVDVIVMLEDSVRDVRAAAADIARNNDARVGFIYEHALRGFSASVPEGRLRGLSNDARVVSVTENRPVYALAETVPTGIKRIDTPAVTNSATNGQGSTVAILDTGIDSSHDDLNVDAGRSKNCMDPAAPNAWQDGHSHGTHVAGTVAALDNTIGVIGVAPAAKLIAVKVLSDSGSGSWATVACGLDHVAQLNNAQPGVSVHAANLSLGGSGSFSDTECATAINALFKAICGAVGSGATVVVSAGNDGTDASGYIPAAHPSVITVSALEDRDGLADTAECSGKGLWKQCDEYFASFSNYGSLVDVIAPGVAINSTVPGDGYASKSGTSMSSPHVSGVVALIQSIYGTTTPLTPDQVRAHLRATGDCPNADNTGYTTNTTGGDCATSGGAWPGDGDDITEPLINAYKAATTTPGAGGGGGGEVTNSAPVAAFTFNNCPELTCQFTDTSTDGDGTIASWSWDFGVANTQTDTSAAQHPSYEYTTGGTYTVTLTVTDDDGAIHSVQKDVAVAAPSGDPPATGSMVLSVASNKIKGEKQADLTWTNADDSGQVEVWVDGVSRGTTADDGSYDTIYLGKGGGTHTFKVCDADDGECSNEVSISY